MEKLTAKQKKFADEYIISGNAYQSAVNAGYSERVAAEMGHKNLRKPKILNYINERTKAVEDETIADMKEVRKLWTDIMRDTNERTPDRLKASEMMARTKGAFIDKQETTINGRLDIGATSEIIEKYLGADGDE